MQARAQFVMSHIRVTYPAGSLWWCRSVVLPICEDLRTEIICMDVWYAHFAGAKMGDAAEGKNGNF